MAGNEWINGYLEAILDVGRNKTDEKLKLSKASPKEDGYGNNLFSPTRYFVEEVINSVDESDLHRTWVKVSSITLTSLFS